MSAQQNLSALSQYEHFVLDDPSGRKLVFLKIGKSVSAQQISEDVYIIRGYQEGKIVPDKHEWVVVIKLDKDASSYEPFAFTAAKKIETEIVIRPSQFRAAHKFFRGMGYKNFVYYRDKGGLGWIKRLNPEGCMTTELHSEE